LPDQLLLPHPRLHERAFVLLPLCDIAPNWRHPLLGRTVAALADDLPDALRNTVNALAISDSRP
jgi:2-amino-4-hydroxy-6-hydroxymethyldihydropteridine diphosphokinase